MPGSSYAGALYPALYSPSTVAVLEGTGVTQLVVELFVPVVAPTRSTQQALEFFTTAASDTSTTQVLVELFVTIASVAPQPEDRRHPTRRLRTFLLPTSPEGRWVFLRRLQVVLQAGVGLSRGQGSDPQVMLQMSRDGGQTWGPERWVSAGRLGDYDAQAVWHNLGRYRDGAVRIVVSDPVAWHFLTADADLQEGSS